VLKFSGCYHGHADHLLVAAGSGLRTFGQPNSAGVPDAFASLTRVLDLDDEDRLEELFHTEGDKIAAAIIEPLPANNGLLVQRHEYLDRLRTLTARHGALLIFDEVISGFRLGPGGYAEREGIEPDLATFGKVIGGGLPVGAFGGPREVMRHLAPDGTVYQAGTLSGNPVAMAAGAATLEILERDDAWSHLEASGARLEAALTPVLEATSVPVRMVREGSIFWLSFQEGPPPRSAAAIPAGGAGVYRQVFHGLLRRGVYLAPSAFEVAFLSTAHDDATLTRLVEALSESLAEVRIDV
jgi:glutamate-1-semialdehyde 2,1-aminomutase